LIKKSYKNEIVDHLPRDSTAIDAREKLIKKKEVTEKKKRGRPKKGEERLKEPTRLDKPQGGMGLPEMLNDLPAACAVGTKKNSKGYKISWTDYKLHIDAADGGISISCVLTSASTHDSQVAIPLAEMSHQRVASGYDLMDAAYDSVQIHEHSKKLGHIPIIDPNPRSNKTLKAELSAEKKRLKVIGHTMAEAVRYVPLSVSMDD